MSTGTGLPTPIGFNTTTIDGSDNLELLVPIAADQFACLYEWTLGTDKAGGGAVPIAEVRQEDGVNFLQTFPGTTGGVPAGLDQPLCLPMGEDLLIHIEKNTTAYTAGTILASVGIGGNMGSGSGLPTPKPYSGGAANGSDWELVITPAAGEHVVVYSVAVGDDLAGTTTSFQLLGGSVVYIQEALAAAGSSDQLNTIDQPIAFPKGVAVTARCTATTAGTILITAALVH